ncbi:YgjP-like metallopeptidase domain-containing protein [Cryobacterium psychrotolerans]|nr:YgjP-like metallopeptidase domain-containing protein [Cryobacterium psychrotolerans]TFD90350.1 M48 family peptidase [Cryobacterium psychrotolerans]
MEDDFQDYVIAHELLHLRYRDHGKKGIPRFITPNH